MALSRSKYRRIPDLYVQGTEVELKDGTTMWMQTLNPFEMDEARHDAQVARSRIVLALKEFGSDELAKVKATLLTQGRERAIDTLVDDQAADILVKATETIANDPDWKERLELAERQEEILARPESDEERKLLLKINEEYVRDVEKIIADEREYMSLKYSSLTDEEMLEEYCRLYIDRRGTELAVAEHRLTEVWYAARCCEGVKDEDGVWSHDACEGHVLKVFETKGEIVTLPEDLQQLLFGTMAALNMTVREAKNSDRQSSSSESSPQPSAEEASTASTQDETPSVAPGT